MRFEYIIIIIITSYLIYKIYNFNILYITCSVCLNFLYLVFTGIFKFIYLIYNTILNLNPFLVKYYLLFNSLIFFICVLIMITLIILVHLKKNNRLKKSIYKPLFFNKFIHRLEILSQFENLDLTIHFYSKILYLCLSLFLFFFLIYLLFFIDI